MKSKTKLDKKEIIITLVIGLLLSILSIASFNKYKEVTNVKEVKKYDNLDESILGISADINYDFEEAKYKINYQNTTPASIIKANFNMYDLHKFIRPINFTDSVSEYSSSNHVFLEKDQINPRKNFLILSDGIYSYNNKIYSFVVEGDEINTEFVGKVPYLKKGDARYLVPKINIVDKDGEKVVESYLYNVTDINVVEYEFIYEDAKSGEQYSIKFDNVSEGEKSDKKYAKAPKSGLIKDIIPQESIMKIVNSEGKEFNVVYNFSTNLILDLDLYREYINYDQGSENDEWKN